MAGRGTDIKLTPEALAAGGLYILGTERHESRRIDNQLRGRAGRQGDKGESRFYISLQDELIRVFAGTQLHDRMKYYGMTEDETIESPFVSKTIEHAQEKVEKHNFEIRKHLLEYDDVMNQHRKVIYNYRREVLEGADQIHELVSDMIVGSMQDIFAQLVPQRMMTPQEVEALLDFLSRMTRLDKTLLKNQPFDLSNADAFEKDVINYVLEQYSLFRSAKDQDQMAQAEKWLMLETIDQSWKQHMLNLDHLKEGISLRSWGQKNPLIEYKKEAFGMFEDMMRIIRWEIVHRLFHLNLESFDASEIERKREDELDELNLVGAGDTVGDNGTVSREEPKTGRNDVCPCGSGKKFKKCCAHAA